MRFAVVGDPVEHSLSPAIHTAAFAAEGIDARFESLRVPAAGFSMVVELLRSGELHGVSVTMPHKHNAFAAVDRRTPRAARSGAVNTITVESGELVGDNTDIAGVSYALEELNVPATDILILGAGGAAGAALIATEQYRVHISARSQQDAERLLVRGGVDAQIVSWGEGVAGAITINATPVGMHGGALPGPAVTLASGLLDMTYGSQPAESRTLAATRGIPVVDGTVMLVGQGLEAFDRFIGIRPDPTVMMRAIVS